MKKKDNLMNDAAVFFLVAVISVSLSVFVGEVNNLTRSNTAQVVGAVATTSLSVTDLRNLITGMQFSLASRSKNPQDARTALDVSNLQVHLATLQTNLASFNPTSVPTISVLTPNGGETLEIGKTYRIKWQASPEIDKVNVAYSYGSGNWNRICVACANTGFFDWDVQVGSTTSGQIKIDLTGFKTGYGSVNDQSDNFLRVITDSMLPKISITAAPITIPLGTASLLTANVSDDTGVTGVQFKVNGAQYGAEIKTAPYTISFSPPNTPNPYNSYEVTAVARDTVGKMGFSNSVPVIVIPDVSSTSTTSVGSLSISPSNSFSAPATVMVGQKGVEMARYRIVNNSNVEASINNMILELSGIYKTNPVNEIFTPGVSGRISFLPDILLGKDILFESKIGVSLIKIPANSNGLLSVFADISNFATPGEKFRLNFMGALGNINPNYTPPASNMMVDTYSLVVPGITSTSTPPTPTPADLPPMVALSALPSPTASVGSEVVLNAAVYDDKGIYSVQFMINGVNQGLGIATIPNRIYKFSQVFAAPGTYTVSAIVKDIAGNTTTSNSILVTVMASPTSGTGTGTASGTVPGGK